jgi:L-fucose dehydrogenase
MDLQLTDKVAIITGGAKGIGAAINTASIREGAIPVIIDQDLQACDQSFAELQLERGRGHRLIMDLQPTESWPKVVEETIRTFGRIDALINNAGGNDGVGLELGSPDKFVDSDTG